MLSLVFTYLQQKIWWIGLECSFFNVYKLRKKNAFEKVTFFTASSNKIRKSVNPIDFYIIILISNMKIL